MTTLALQFSPVQARRAIDDPHHDGMIGIALAVVMVVGFGGWAVSTRLDAAVTSAGVVRAAGGRVSVQAPTGGVVAAVHVANGARVRAGQVLVDLENGDALAQERALAARVFALRAEVARIDAEARGVRTLATPSDFADLDPRDRSVAQSSLALEQAQLDAQHRLENAESAVLHDRTTQVRQQVVGYRERLTSIKAQGEYNREELDVYQTLYRKGLATKPRLLALERSAASLDGDAGAASAEIARLNTQAGEAQLTLTQTQSQRREQGADRLRTAQSELQAVLPQWQAARAQLAHTVVRAPVDGVVSAAVMPAAGTVVGTGNKLMEVVPTSKSLLVETRVSVADANELVVGQDARVRLSGVSGHNLVPLPGRIERVSADTVEDERTGQPFYVAAVRVSAAALAATGRDADLAGGIRAGTPVQVVVPVRRRSVMAFLFDPLQSRMANIFAQR